MRKRLPACSASAERRWLDLKSNNPLIVSWFLGQVIPLRIAAALMIVLSGQCALVPAISLSDRMLRWHHVKCSICKSNIMEEIGRFILNPSEVFRRIVHQFKHIQVILVSLNSSLQPYLFSRHIFDWTSLRTQTMTGRGNRIMFTFNDLSTYSFSHLFDILLTNPERQLSEVSQRKNFSLNIYFGLAILRSSKILTKL